MGREGRCFGTFRTTLEVILRPCREEDLEHLEWFGWFRPHREIIRAAYRRQEAGEVSMIVAESSGFPIGQVWIDLTKRARDSAGLLWALRVLPGMQGSGVGARLVGAAECVIHDRGLGWSEVGVEKTVDVASFYERLGYRAVGELAEEWAYTTPEGRERRAVVDQWVLRKRLGTGEGR